jgi:hypothetical protein
MLSTSHAVLGLEDVSMACAAHGLPTVSVAAGAVGRAWPPGPVQVSAAAGSC